MSFSIEGGCDCRGVRYRLTAAPLIVHCCHCRWCQRETGASFALNAVIEDDRMELTAGTADCIDTPSDSGRGQRIWRCPSCKLALWSNYSGGGDRFRFVRVGTLDDPDRCPPDVHIFTSTKQPWAVLPADARVYAEFYEREEVWSAASLERRVQRLARP